MKPTTLRHHGLGSAPRGPPLPWLPNGFQEDPRIPKLRGAFWASAGPSEAVFVGPAVFFSAWGETRGKPVTKVLHTWRFATSDVVIEYGLGFLPLGFVSKTEQSLGFLLANRAESLSRDSQAAGACVPLLVLPGAPIVKIN